MASTDTTHTHIDALAPDAPDLALPGADAIEEVAEADARPAPKAVTIGAVCKALVQEFPDISISKIRYLEDQKLLAPRRLTGILAKQSAQCVLLQRELTFQAGQENPEVRYANRRRGVQITKAAF